MTRHPSTFESLAGLALALVVGVGVAGCDSFDPRVRAEETPPARLAAKDSSAATKTRDADLGLARQLSSAFEDVAEQVGPSVVSIATERGPQTTMQRQRGQD